MVMNRSFAVFVAALAFAPTAALSQGDDAAPPSIVVQGQGTVSHAPDTASISVTIESNDPSATAAQADNNTRYNAVVAALARMATADAPTQIAPSNVEVRASVTVTYAIAAN